MTSASGKAKFVPAEIPVLHPRPLAELEEVGRASMPSLVVDVIATFLNESPTILKNLEAALVRRDLPALRRLAHKLKSSSATLGLQRVSFICQALEVMDVIDTASSEYVAELGVELSSGATALRAYGRKVAS